MLTTVFLYFTLSLLFAGQCSMRRKIDPADLPDHILDIGHGVEYGIGRALILFH